jgi:hypothetical protein
MTDHNKTKRQKSEYSILDSFPFILSTSGKSALDAYDNHCDKVGKLIDYARTLGFEYNEDLVESDNTKVYRQEDNGSETLVEGWKVGEADEA